MKRFEGKSVLVTGASSGIGRAVAVALSKEGGRIVLVARNEEALHETVSMMDNRDAHIVVPFDLTDFDQYGMMFRNLSERGVVLSGLVHCAGIAPVLPLRILSKDNSSAVFDLHYFAFIELVKYYQKKGMSDGGSIVGISSINAHVPQKCMTAYAAAKSAVEAACRTMAIELIERNIRINSVVVGGVNTNMAKKTGEVLTGIREKEIEKGSESAKRQLLDIASPEQLTGPILFLLSNESSYITGRELYADGGNL